MKTNSQSLHVPRTTFREAIVSNVGNKFVAGLGSQINMFVNTMRSQATRMLKRSNCVRKYAHARIG